MTFLLYKTSVTDIFPDSSLPAPECRHSLHGLYARFSVHGLQLPLQTVRRFIRRRKESSGRVNFINEPVRFSILTPHIKTTAENPALFLSDGQYAFVSPTKNISFFRQRF